MKLIAVTPPQDIKDEHHYIAMLVAEGFVVHCRKPDKTAIELAAYLRNIAPDFRSTVAIHSHHELAADMGIKRLHFPERMRLETSFKDEKYYNFQLSSSFHEKSQVTVKNTKYFSYIFCGPVFNSISKKDYPGMEEWQMPVSKISETEKVAIGGMTPDKFTQVRKWGYEGIAFSGYLWERPKDLETRINNIKEVWLKDVTY